MEMIIIEIIIGAAALGAVAWPLINKRAVEDSGPTLSNNEYSALLYRKDAAYMAIKDLEFDYSTSKIDEADYKKMKSSLEAEAIDILKEVESYKSGEPTTKTAKKVELFCHQCGIALDNSHKYCPSCGAKQ
jgi:rubrerythrin